MWCGFAWCVSVLCGLSRVCCVCDVVCLIMEGHRRSCICYMLHVICHMSYVSVSVSVHVCTCVSSIQHVTPMIRGIGSVLFSQLSNIERAGSSGNSRWTSGARENPVFFFSSLFLLSTLPPHSTSRSHASVCTFKRPHVYRQHVHTSLYTWTWCRYTQGTF